MFSIVRASPVDAGPRVAPPHPDAAADPRQMSAARWIAFRNELAARAHAERERVLREAYRRVGSWLRNPLTRTVAVKGCFLPPSGTPVRIEPLVPLKHGE